MSLIWRRKGPGGGEGVGAGEGQEKSGRTGEEKCEEGSRKSGWGMKL